MAAQYIGRAVMVIANPAAVRYEGIVADIDTVSQAITLSQVRSFGSENRVAMGVPPSAATLKTVVIRAVDVVELQLIDSPSLSPSSPSPSSGGSVGGGGGAKASRVSSVSPPQGGYASGGGSHSTQSTSYDGPYSRPNAYTGSNTAGTSGGSGRPPPQSYQGGYGVSQPAYSPSPQDYQQQQQHHQQVHGGGGGGGGRNSNKSSSKKKHSHGAREASEYEDLPYVTNAERYRNYGPLERDHSGPVDGSAPIGVGGRITHGGGSNGETFEASGELESEFDFSSAHSTFDKKKEWVAIRGIEEREAAGIITPSKVVDAFKISQIRSNLNMLVDNTRRNRDRMVELSRTSEYLGVAQLKEIEENLERTLNCVRSVRNFLEEQHEQHEQSQQ